MNNLTKEIGCRLKEIREHFEFTQTTFAEKLELTPQTYSNYEKGNRDLPDLVKIKLKMFKVNIDWLLTGEGEMFSEPSLPASGNGGKIPLLRQTVSCGPGQDWQEADAIERWIEPLSDFPGVSGKDIYAFRVRGTSMVGAGISDGDIVIFDAKSGADNDDIYVFSLEGNVYCKLLKFDAISRKVKIYSVHSNKLDEAELLRTLDADSPTALETFRLFGKVLAWLHENRVMYR